MTMKKSVLALTAILLCGCCAVSCSSGTKTEEVPNLAGSWIQNNGKDTYMTADVTDTTIDVYWTYTDSDTKAVYWSGSYTAPTTAGAFTWTSENNHEITDGSILASGSETKEFSYTENGNITFELSALGITQTVTLDRAE